MIGLRLRKNRIASNSSLVSVQEADELGVAPEPLQLGPAQQAADSRVRDPLLAPRPRLPSLPRQLAATSELPGTPVADHSVRDQAAAGSLGPEQASGAPGNAPEPPQLGPARQAAIAHSVQNPLPAPWPRSPAMARQVAATSELPEDLDPCVWVLALRLLLQALRCLCCQAAENLPAQVDNPLFQP